MQDDGERMLLTEPDGPGQDPSVPNLGVPINAGVAQVATAETRSWNRFYYLQICRWRWSTAFFSGINYAYIEKVQFIIFFQIL